MRTIGSEPFGRRGMNPLPQGGESEEKSARRNAPENVEQLLDEALGNQVPADWDSASRPADAPFDMPYWPVPDVEGWDTAPDWTPSDQETRDEPADDAFCGPSSDASDDLSEHMSEGRANRAFDCCSDCADCLTGRNFDRASSREERAKEEALDFEMPYEEEFVGTASRQNGSFVERPGQKTSFSELPQDGETLGGFEDKSDDEAPDGFEDKSDDEAPDGLGIESAGETPGGPEDDPDGASDEELPDGLSEEDDASEGSSYGEPDLAWNPAMAAPRRGGEPGVDFPFDEAQGGLTWAAASAVPWKTPEEEPSAPQAPGTPDGNPQVPEGPREVLARPYQVPEIRAAGRRGDALPGIFIPGAFPLPGVGMPGAYPGGMPGGMPGFAPLPGFIPGEPTGPDVEDPERARAACEERAVRSFGIRTPRETANRTAPRRAVSARSRNCYGGEPRTAAQESAAAHAKMRNKRGRRFEACLVSVLTALVLLCGGLFSAVSLQRFSVRRGGQVVETAAEVLAGGSAARVNAPAKKGQSPKKGSSGKSAGGNAAPSVKRSGSEIVIERTTGKVLSGSNERLELPMASTTKVMTAILAIENCEDLDQKHEIPRAAVGIEGSSIYLVEGETLSMRELLYGLMLRSGNDCAHAVAILTAGSVDAFVEKMNDKAVSLGLRNTRFANPSGLPADEHYTSAYDLAVLTAYALGNETFRTVVSTKSVQISNSTQDYPRVLKNKNKMLWEFEGGIGVKTGYTKQAGRCLVSAAKRGNLELVSVVLNCPDMWEVSKQNMNNCFAKYEFCTVLRKGQLPQTLPVEGGKLERAALYLKEDVNLLLEKDAELEIVYALPERLVAPLKADQIVGEVRIMAQKELLFCAKIYNIEEVEEKTERIFDRIFRNWSTL